MFKMRKKYKVENMRRFKRLQADYLVKFQKVSSDEEPSLANIKDISAGGLKFWSKQLFPEGTLLKIEAWVPPIEKTLVTLGKIIRIRRARKSVYFYYGIEFVELSKDDKMLLNEFIESMAHETKGYPFVSHADIVERQVLEAIG
ncbi:MAG: PilZ domain-containing protein [Candidatus Omnitrophica bacterium]|nr:PilZ domain-containing protein [Candidatus Omnitrophota bacterium]